jgi:hypothetical protein
MAYALNKPVPWHEVANTGDTTARFLVIEMKYQKWRFLSPSQKGSLAAVGRCGY